VVGARLESKRPVLNEGEHLGLRKVLPNAAPKLRQARVVRQAGRVGEELMNRDSAEVAGEVRQMPDDLVLNREPSHLLEFEDESCRERLRDRANAEDGFRVYGDLVLQVGEPV